ncbi:hypothetical protein EV191_1011305 [Tamaricihabitans halophyticus]|uniref:Uncharacterized protein n=1 Tax=Tamaricihabitans halophyticus TaxID=1262583 RepID=A0A4R2R3F7_9PSEU|nr:hypothetical protein [Tamaricihabitans halophyticus]TCP57350.1 hypothetical protein EV191_1011305 [Tamaricihabitans halophyticus]
MYVDETGGADTTDTTDTEATGELTVTVGGDEYSAETNFDGNEDGTNDTILQETDSGYDQFSDTDGDGKADLYIERDAQGNVVSAAQFDEASGKWYAVDPNTGEPGGEDTDANQGDTSGGGDITVQTSSGETNAGEATVDTSGDGQNDTAVVQDANGGTTMYTDSDGDGAADVETKVDAQGNVVISEHQGNGEWTEVERGRIDGQGTYRPDTASGVTGDSDELWGAGGGGNLEEGVARIDSATGQWISNN